MNRRHRGWLIRAGLIVCVLEGARAPRRVDAQSAPDKIALEAGLAASAMGNFLLDETGLASERRQELTARLRLGGTFERGDLRLVAELDLIEGQVAGDLSSVGTVRGTDTFALRRDRLQGFFGFTPRALYLRATTPYGVLTAGQQTSDWGLGLVANAGRDSEGFGAATGGSIVDRIGFGTRPLKNVEGLPEILRATVVAASADLVFRDDNAALVSGDIAGGGSLALRWEAEGVQFGALQSIRVQRDRYDAADPGGIPRALTVFLSDAFLSARLFGSEEAWALSASGEVALANGQTTRPVFEATVIDGALIQSLGGVARFELSYADQFLLRLEAGQASGDGDPYDARVNGFSFNSAYRVGLILFPQVLPLRTARAIDRLANPELVGTPPPSLRFAVNQGAVTNSRYLYPTLRWKFLTPLELRIGYLLAGSSSQLVDAYRTVKVGGYPVGPNGTPTGETLLGQEFLVGLRGKFPLGLGTLRAELEASVFLPGSQLSSAGVGTIGLVRGAVTWAY